MATPGTACDTASSREVASAVTPVLPPVGFPAHQALGARDSHARSRTTVAGMGLRPTEEGGTTAPSPMRTHTASHAIAREDGRHCCRILSVPE